MTWRAVHPLVFAVIGVTLVLGACTSPPTATVSPSSIDVGTVTVGTTGTSGPVDVRVANWFAAGNDLVTARVDGSGPFAVDSFSCPTAEAEIPAGQVIGTLVCHLKVRFHPTTDGTAHGNVGVYVLWQRVASVPVSGETAPTPVLGESGLAVALPVVGLGALASGWWVVRRRRVVAPTSA